MKPATLGHDLVPLADRIRYLQTFRFGAACLVLASWLPGPLVHHASFTVVGAVTAAYLMLSLAGEAIWRVMPGRGLFLFGAMLLVDGVYLGWLTYVTGGPSSPLTGLVVVHVIAVALLASFWTGTKIAMWHSLLALGAFYAEEAGVLPVPGGGSVAFGDQTFWLLVAYVVVIWVVAIATASYAAVNERELRRRRYDLEALARLAFQLEETTEPHAVARALVNAVVDDFEFERALVLAEAGDTLEELASHGTERPRSGASPDEDAVLRAGGLTPQSLRVSGLDSEHNPWLSAVVPGARNLVIVPLHAEGHGLGFLIAEHSRRRSSRIERRVLSMVERYASQSALALANARLLETVQRLAIYDELTGLVNRRHFEATLEREIERSVRTGAPLSLVLLDIDHFKKVNDTHGHRAGDAVLKAVAHELRRSARAIDTVARYGGEEFAIVLPDASGADALDVAERIRVAIEALEGPVRVSVSVGLATSAAGARDAEGLVDDTDRALYESKRAGRNRVTVREGEWAA